MSGIVVIKCGGSMIDSLSGDFYASIKSLQDNGYKPIIVHGGGPAINKLLNELQIKSEFVNGLRKTTPDVLNVVEMVLSGTMTNKLVRQLQKNGITSIGITGSDGGLLQAEAIDLETLGLVGNITKVNHDLLHNLISIGMVPVISPIATSVNGSESYNINADTAAAAIAVAVQAEKLLFVTDVPGVLKDSRIIENATSTEIMSLIKDGTISGGMIPKVMAAVHSLEGGMDEVMIVSGQTRLLEGENIVGTTIRKELEAVI